MSWNVPATSATCARFSATGESHVSTTSSWSTYRRAPSSASTYSVYVSLVLARSLPVQRAET